MKLIELLKRKISVTLRNSIRYKLPRSMLRKKSYSQCGEDLIIYFLLSLIKGKAQISYLDIGANHPFHLSNTALLYKNGARGVLVEPDPFFVNLLRSKRPRDTVLSAGVHFLGENSSEFYIMDSPTLNTFSPTEVERYIGMGHKLVKKINVSLVDVNEVLEQFQELDFLNLDVEGLDFAILKKIDWERNRPKCLCVETIMYEKENEPKKQTEIIEFMELHNYFVYADTFINTIFVDRNVWSHRWNSNNKI